MFYLYSADTAPKADGPSIRGFMGLPNKGQPGQTGPQSRRRSSGGGGGGSGLMIPTMDQKLHDHGKYEQNEMFFAIFRCQIRNFQ